MSIQLLARDLYSLIREVEELERRLEAAPHARRAAIERELHGKRADRDLLRNALEGRKEG